MCFSINFEAKRPRARTVYKILYVNPNGYLQSPIYSSEGTRYQWNYPGDTLFTGGPYARNWQASRGFYVFTSLAAAKKEFKICYSENWHIIVALTVDPEDWLFQDIRRPAVNTYKRVTIKEEQPYLEWY